MNSNYDLFCILVKERSQEIKGDFLQLDVSPIDIGAKAYRLWLDRGFHQTKMGAVQPIKVNEEVIKKNFGNFILKVDVFFDKIGTERPLVVIKTIYEEIKSKTWVKIYEIQLIELFVQSYNMWRNSVKKRNQLGGQDE